jgi:hypothetical protein
VDRRAAVAISGAALASMAAFACSRPAHAPAESATNAAPAAPRPDAPSVLLLTLDTTRADALHCFGAQAADASPRLDAFAAEGVRFTQARTTAPMSLPSHARFSPDAGRLEHRRARQHALRRRISSRSTRCSD